MSENSKLPEKWTITTLGKVSEIQSGTGFPKRLQGQTEGDFPFAKVGDISNAYLNNSGLLSYANNYLDNAQVQEIKAKIYPPNSILFAKIGEAIRLNRRVINTISVLADNNVVGLIPDEACIYPKYLYYYSQTIELYEYSRATTVPSIRKSDIEEITLPLAPLNEQQRIVDAIEALFTNLDAGVEILKRLQSNLKRYRASVLKAACEGQLVPQDPDDEPAAELLERILAERRACWEEQTLAEYEVKGKNPPKNWQDRYQEPIPPDTSDLPELPEGWVWASLDEIAEVRGGVTKGRRLENHETIYVPYLRVANVQDGFLDLSEIKTIEIKVHEIEKYRLHYGDILFNEGGDRDKLGRGTIWKNEIEDCAHQNHVYSARVYSSDVLPRWVDYIRRTENAKQYFWRTASQTVNLASINKTNLSLLPVPLAPLSEQELILDEIDRYQTIIDEINEAIEISLIRADRLRQSILKEAFAGRLVPQDPNDEPASELLARIDGTLF